MFRMLVAFFKKRKKAHNAQGITCPSPDYLSYILMRDKNGNELLVENNCTHLPKYGPRIHPELIYEKRKQRWGVDINESLLSVGLTREEARALVTKRGTWQNTLKHAIKGNDQFKTGR